MSAIHLRYECHDESAPAEHALTQTGWARELRHLCALLGDAPEGASAAVSVTVRPAAGEAICLPLLCRHLAGDYGLAQTVTTEGESYTVRFRRAASPGAPAGIRARLAQLRRVGRRIEAREES